MTDQEVKCPRCKKTTVYNSENAFRPFYSKRCKLIDLGEWADEKYTVPSEEAPSSEDIDTILDGQKKSDVH